MRKSKPQQHLKSQVGMAKKNTTSSKSKSKARKNVLERINPNAAGVDIGANFHLVAIPEDRAEENIKKFGPFSSDLHRLGRLADRTSDSNRRDGINRRLLDSGVPDP